MQPSVTPARPLGVTPAPTIETIAFAFVIAAAVVSFLYFGRDILVPLALASLLSFVIWPLISVLRKAHFGRIGSVLVAVTVAIAGLLALGAVMAVQVTELAGDLPRYEANLRDKVRALKGASMPAGAMEKAADTLQGLQDELKKGDGTASPMAPAAPAAPPPGATQMPQGNPSNPIVVELRNRAPTASEIYQDVVKPVLSPLTTAALVLLFLIFILLQREDLRDRVLRLAGGSDLQRSTLAMSDAASRLSRFFLIQLALNVSFGVLIGIGLALIGVPSPILWGILAALMRFVPYVGTVVAAIFPIALAAAVDPSWSMVVATATLFLVAEPIAGHFIEPILLGKNIGLSPVAVVVAALFWTLLWGPVGLLLSTPLTVCLVVLGKHVPALDFLTIVLGDEPALAPEQRLYQRLLAGDAGEVAALADDALKDQKLASYYDAVVMETLKLAYLDAARGRLDRDAQIALLATVQDATADLDDDAPVAAGDPADANGPAVESTVGSSPSNEAGVSVAAHAIRPHVLCLAARSALDETAAHLMSQLLIKHGITSEVLGRTAASQLTAASFSAASTVVCLSYFGTDSPLHVRFLIRRLKRIAPDVQIIAGFWMLRDDASTMAAWQTEAGAHFATASLSDAETLCLAAAKRSAPSGSDASFKSVVAKVA